jgi:hypothetical protein
MEEILQNRTSFLLLNEAGQLSLIAERQAARLLLLQERDRAAIRKPRSAAPKKDSFLQLIEQLPVDIQALLKGDKK